MPPTFFTKFSTNPQTSIDAEHGIIRGVSVMTEGIARGHGITIDSTGLNQCLAASVSHGEQGVKLLFDHDSKFSDIVGAVKNFRIIGDQLLGDIDLLQSHPDRNFVLEIAQKLSNEFGLSVETHGADETKDGKKFFRCTDISAIALVPNPAANPTGLFEAVDKKQNIEPMNEDDINKLIAAAIAPLTATISDLQSKIDASNQPPVGDDADPATPDADPNPDDAPNPDADPNPDDKPATYSAKQLKKLIEDASAREVQKFAAKIGVKKAPQNFGGQGLERPTNKFSAKVDELAKAGVRDPFATAAMKFPDLYNEQRKLEETGGLK